MKGQGRRVGHCDQIDGKCGGKGGKAVPRCSPSVLARCPSPPPAHNTTPHTPHLQPARQASARPGQDPRKQVCVGRRERGRATPGPSCLCWPLLVPPSRPSLLGASRRTPSLLGLAHPSRTLRVQQLSARFRPKRATGASLPPGALDGRAVAKSGPCQSTRNKFRCCSQARPAGPLAPLAWVVTGWGRRAWHGRGGA